ncbi:hypothetical protein BDZ90DRAFT_231979 [Jaminaea rosea]|uniref:F-box domain-containing protein n=1 Tax=Jaminaea rosea TaxID=1569628 RepID=A0A316UTV1_9BASI|nr:hypothetical protein BDZ90DRAFT_231979 [Jaminaea rosea]PWN28228.1 hypothetical protein BDZ90DRAFT_231979 [Jaminaea rosea]
MEQRGTPPQASSSSSSSSSSSDPMLALATLPFTSVEESPSPATTEAPLPIAQNYYQPHPWQLAGVVSSDSLPLSTPPIQQQESILTSLSQSLAVAAPSDDEEEGGSQAQPAKRTASSKPTQDKGNGWAMLTQPRSSVVAPPRRSSTAAAAAAAPSSARASTSAQPYEVATTSTPVEDDISSRRPVASINKLGDEDSMLAVSSATALPPSSYSSSPRPPPAAPTGCDSPSKSALRSGRDSALQQQGGSMELPAEGSGLRGKDEVGLDVDGDMHEADNMEDQDDGDVATPLPSSFNPLQPPPARKLCIRHQRMADEGTVGKLQRSIESLPLADQTAVNSVWSIFSSSSHARRALILQGILSMCCFSQLSLLSSELALAIRIDPFCLFPREVSLKVLGHLDAMSLGRAAQVSRAWKELADDDLLWRNMCEQHIERKCEKCGWGLPLLSEKKRRVKGATPAAGTPESRSLTAPLAANLDAASEALSSQTGGGSGANAGAGNPGSGNLKRSITAAANAAALERHSKTAQNSRASSPTASGEDSGRPSKRPRSADVKPSALHRSTSQVHDSNNVGPVTRPWKSVYCERLAIERNWRRGRYSIRTLKGHTDGIMCLQFNESLSHPPFPVVITGSYDRTARIWNMDTGEELRVLKGHTRGVRCLQFDEAKLITGSMDRTLKIWNWRTGALVRTLEGHTEGIVCLNFNDHLLASGSADSNIKIWNFKTGQCFTLKGHTDWVNSVWLWSGPQPKHRSADSDGAENTFLFSASDDGTIRLWDLAKRECLMVYTGHVGQTQGLSLVQMPEEVVETLANGGNVGGSAAPEQARQHQQQEGLEQRDGGSGGGAASPSYFTPNSDAPAACGYNPPAVPGGRSANTGTAPSIPEHFYAAPASGQHRTALRQQQQHHSIRPIEPRLLKLQQRLAAAGLVNPLPIDAEMGDLEWGAARRASQRSHHGGGGAGETGKPTTTMTTSTSSSSTSPPHRPSSSSSSTSPPPASASHHPASERLRPILFSCSLDNTIKIWDVRTGSCIRTLFGHMAGLWALSTDRLRLATASHDSTLKIWELATGKHLFSICEHRGPVTSVQLADSFLASGSDDGQVNIYSFAAQ